MKRNRMTSHSLQPAMTSSRMEYDLRLLTEAAAVVVVVVVVVVSWGLV